MLVEAAAVLGCSRCRYSAKGCSRCRAPTFTGQRGRPAAKQPGDEDAALPQHEATTPQPVQQQDAAHTSKVPEQLTAGPVQPGQTDEQQPAEAPSSSEESKPSRYFAAAAAQPDAEQEAPTSRAAGAKAGSAAAETSSPAVAGAAEAHTEQAAASVQQASEAAEATASDTSAAALSDGSLSGLSDFQSKLQEKLLQNKTSPRKRLPGGLRHQDKPNKRIRVKVQPPPCAANPPPASCSSSARAHHVQPAITHCLLCSTNHAHEGAEAS